MVAILFLLLGAIFVALGALYVERAAMFRALYSFALAAVCFYQYTSFIQS